jgi:hypothetical protein
MDERSGDDLVTFESTIDDAIVGALQGQDLTGFEIWRRLGSEEGAAGSLTERLLYPTLHHLEADGRLRSDWQEGEHTRRKYRLTATASAQAASGDRRVPEAARQADRRAVSPDPESGAWFMPPKDMPPVSPVEPPTLPAAASPLPGTLGTGRPGETAMKAYVDDLGAGLDLPRAEQIRVRQEIADHLRDCVQALEQQGYDTQAAATEALNRLGPSAALARAIEQAQQTPSRRRRAIRRGVLEIVGEMVLWLALSVVAFTLAPGVVDVVTGLGRMAGLHLVVLRSAEWTTSQATLMLGVGAFAAGRISLGRLARISRHSEATLRKRWALGWALALLAVVLVIPGYEDALAVATLLAVPIAFVAGTLRPQQFREGAYSVRGIATAALVVAVIVLLPFSRLFAYDPNGTPGTPLAGGVDAVVISVDAQAGGTFTYGVSQQSGAGAVAVELWPAATDGPFIVVDRSVAKATLSIQPGSSVDPAKLPPYRQWWVVAVSTARDGTRTALAVIIQTGASSKPSTALGWLISRL